MYDIVSQPLKEITLIYIMFGGACILTFPITMLIANAATKWRG